MNQPMIDNSFDEIVIVFTDGPLELDIAWRDHPDWTIKVYINN